VLLAYLPAVEQRAAIARVELVRRGPNTITSRRELARELERVRDAGLAVSNEELAFGLRSIAAPVRAQTGGVVAAINLAVHRSMVSLEDLVANLAPALQRTAAEISGHLGVGQVRL
jgi:IclR family transcriptional regulator, pca regulon regulatory protein